MSENVIPFPAPVVRLRIEPRQSIQQNELLAVEHDGRVYSLTTLLARLPGHVLDEIEALAPGSAQGAWDLVVRRRPLWAKAAIGAI